MHIVVVVRCIRNAGCLNLKRCGVHLGITIVSYTLGAVMVLASALADVFLAAPRSLNATILQHVSYYQSHSTASPASLWSMERLLVGGLFLLLVDRAYAIVLMVRRLRDTVFYPRRGRPTFPLPLWRVLLCFAAHMLAGSGIQAIHDWGTVHAISAAAVWSPLCPCQQMQRRVRHFIPW